MRKGEAVQFVWKPYGRLQLLTTQEGISIETSRSSLVFILLVGLMNLNF